MGWRNRTVWYRVGYALTVLWMLGIVLTTNGNMADPLFDFIFIVPLAAWIVGVTVARLINRADKNTPGQ